jgi:exodeoxyribonuclease VII large subunit
MPENDSERKIYSISQITRKIRTLLEFQVGEVWVEGEVSNRRKQASGHQYFTLKDSGAQLSCVLFRGNARSLTCEIEDGQQIQAFGELSVYEARGQYQLIIRHVQQKGAGLLQAKFDALKSKLQAEGLFDTDQKRDIPKYPKVIALVTSPTGAALRDMLNIVARRAPWVRILIYPVRVQGKGAEEEIAAAIADLNDATGHTLPDIDTIVTGRGGGSIEDLWCFNEEVVARAIRASAIPVISAVGHEIDFTIADLAADLRAPTPSAAAELMIPDQLELRRHLEKLANGMTQVVTGVVRHQRRVLELLARGVLQREPNRIVEEYQQQLDQLAESLAASITARLDEFQARADKAGQVLQINRPDHAVAQYRQRLEAIEHRITSSAEHFMQQRIHRLETAASLLRNLGPEATFARGFSVTIDEKGQAISSVKRVKPGQRVRTRLGDGDFESNVAG